MSDLESSWERLKELMEKQFLGVLSTRIDTQPYSNLVAFATDSELKSIYFATTRTTRKYHNLTMEPQASILVDDRTNTIADFHRASTVTALGLVEEIEEADREAFLRIYLGKHPALESFVRSPNCAYLKLNVKKYIVVNRFQNVVEIEV